MGRHRLLMIERVRTCVRARSNGKGRPLARNLLQEMAMHNEAFTPIPRECSSSIAKSG